MDFEIAREIKDELHELVAQILFGVSRRPKGAPPEQTRAAD